MAKAKAAEVVADINVTPMVDVMLVMLIIFMVITPMLTKGVQVELVKTKNPIAMADADKDDAVLVSVSRNGDVFLGSTKTTADSLPGKVKDLLTNRISKICYLKCDQRSRYERVVEVVDNLRAAGVDQVGLLTESMDPKSQGTEKPAGAGI
jgi:biopolymer transport protein ExbD/biopolymer transport protein TolR